MPALHRRAFLARSAAGTLLAAGAGRAMGTPRRPGIAAVDHGVKADAVIAPASDGAITAGSRSFTSASGGFTPAINGKTIMVAGAGNGGSAPDLVAVATYVSATTLTLSLPAGRTVSGAAYAYGSDNTAALNALLANANGMTVYFPAGDMFCAGTVSFASSNVTYEGWGLARLISPVATITNPGQNAFRWGACHDVTMRGLRFLSLSTAQGTDPATGALYGAIFMAGNVAMSRIRIVDCEISSPNHYATFMFFLSSDAGTGILYDDIEITNLYAHDCLNCAVAFWGSSSTTPSAPRIRNCRVKGGRYSNIGCAALAALPPSPWGMAISFAAPGTHCAVEGATFNGCWLYAIENVAVNGFRVMGNTGANFQGTASTSYTRLISMTPTTKLSGQVVMGNQLLDYSANTAFHITNIADLTMMGNTWQTSQAVGTMSTEFGAIDDLKVVGDHFITKGDRAVFFTGALANPASFESCTFDTTQGSSTLGLLVGYSANATGMVRLNNATLKRNNAGFRAGNSSGSAISFIFTGSSENGRGLPDAKPL